jgi:hypothetical protein
LTPPVGQQDLTQRAAKSVLPACPHRDHLAEDQPRGHLLGALPKRLTLLGAVDPLKPES